MVPRLTRAMAQCSLKIRQHALDAACVLGTNVVGAAQVALALGGLLREDVALEGVAGLELAGGGLAEPLGRRPVGLDLGHGDVLSVLSTDTSGGFPHFPSCLNRLYGLPLRASVSNPGEPGRA